MLLGEDIFGLSSNIVRVEELLLGAHDVLQAVRLMLFLAVSDRLRICVLDIAVLIRVERDLPCRIFSCHDEAIRRVVLHFTIIVGNSIILRFIFQILGNFVDFNRLSIFTRLFVAKIVCHSFREKTCCLNMQIYDFTIDLAI